MPELIEKMEKSGLFFPHKQFCRLTLQLKLFFDLIFCTTRGVLNC